MSDFSELNVIIDRISKILKEKGSAAVAVDGGSGTGKTTLARRISEKIDCNIFKVDDFFLRPQQRTEERLNTPGGNFDMERLKEEVLLPISRGESVNYRPYDCHTREIKKGVYVPYKKINVVEGVYSCHPDISGFFDLKIFLDVPYDVRIKRLEEREEPKSLERFKNIWIPLEDKYFEYFRIKDTCDIIIK